MRVLCIATHPDDETLGCGGTLLRHIAEGDDVSWLIGTEAWAPKYPRELIELREKEIENVSAAYGFREVRRLGLPTARLDRESEDEIITALTEHLTDLRPDIVYLNHAGDAHTDHRILFGCVMATLKPFRTGLRVNRIYAYETLSESDQAPARSESVFLPNAFVEITPYIDRKLEILALYESELQPYPLPRESSAVRALARVRGATIAAEHAEAFATVREVR